MEFPFAGILLRVGFWRIGRDICTNISGHREGRPRELVLTLAYLGWPGLGALSLRALLGGGGLEEGRRPYGPVQSDQACKVCAAASLGFRFTLISPLWRPPLPPWVGERDQEHSSERGESQTH